VDIYRCRYRTAKGENVTRELTKDGRDRVMAIAKRHKLPCSCKRVRVARSIGEMP
jgi:hypothetical protein